nr:agmatine deiminase family protein [Aureimonas ureilytica]
MHERTFMQWPSDPAIYEGDELDAVQLALVRIANAIAEHEPVVMLTDQATRGGNRAKLAGAVELWDIPTDDLWCRDAGPTFVVDGAGALAIAHLRFNGWGGKQDHGNDGRIAARVAERLGLPLLETGLVGEQGGVEHDGAGLVLAHASSWLGPSRNDLPLATIGDRLCKALGGSRMIWAPGLVGEDITDFHIDALARFTAPGRFLIQIEDNPDPGDVWSMAAAETLKVLEAVRSAQDRPLEIVKLTGPGHVRSSAQDFVGSYINYYVCNGAVIAPEFGDEETDAQARETLGVLYPGRVVRMLDIDAIAEMGGGIHCATQQQPRSQR